MSEYILPNGTPATEVCLPCKTGLHDECEDFWVGAAGSQVTDVSCCCGGQYDSMKHLVTLILSRPDDTAPAKREKAAPENVPADLGLGKWGTAELLPDGKKRGDSGYIHPLAWPSGRDIGTLKEPLSTGRKRVAAMYPIPKGKTCEWAGRAQAGGGLHPIVGCIGYPATDLHHGPDKNTLNNMRSSEQLEYDAQNVHQICSFCHNAWHAANDADYPERDYLADQASPWLPEGGEIFDHDPDTMADQETLYKVDAERRADADRRTGGRKDWENDGPDFGELSDDE
jgi:hypothetical protein